MPRTIYTMQWLGDIDGSLQYFGCCQLVYVAQLFYKLDECGRSEILAVKVVDDLLLARSTNTLQSTTDMVSARYKVGIIVFSVGLFLFNGLRITQYNDHSSAVEADERISGINPVLITV